MKTKKNVVIISLAGCLIASLFPLLLKHSFQQADIELLAYINLKRDLYLDTFFKLVSDSVTYICIGVFVILIAVRSFRRHLPYFVTSFICAALAAAILKFTFLRQRPFLTYHFIQKLSGGGSPSFPSGHTTDAFVLAVAIGLVSGRWYVRAVMYAWAILVAYSRLDLGVHYPSDVLAGMAIGSMAAVICYGGRMWEWPTSLAAII